jgi:LmbE family N-acetylglucosaminyl deacetylase
LDIEPHKKNRSAVLIVAHPDDETLWAGGTVLNQPTWDWFIITLCRSSDTDRAPRFFKAIQALGAQGRMGDLDDGPDQIPLTGKMVQEAILDLLPRKQFDLIVTHNPAGEYTRHLRHEEAGRAAITLWHEGYISADEFWTFAYEDGGRKYRPRPIAHAHAHHPLPESIWQVKYDLITETYGFEKNGFEAETTPRAEAFWQFKNSADARFWLDSEAFHHARSRPI